MHGPGRTDTSSHVVAPEVVMTPPDVPREFPALKIGLYEILIRQLQDDGLSAIATRLSTELKIAPNTHAPRDTLFTLYESLTASSQLQIAHLLNQGHEPITPDLNHSGSGHLVSHPATQFANSTTTSALHSPSPAPSNLLPQKLQVDPSSSSPPSTTQIPSEWPHSMTTTTAQSSLDQRALSAATVSAIASAIAAAGHSPEKVQAGDAYPRAPLQLAWTPMELQAIPPPSVEEVSLSLNFDAYTSSRSLVVVSVPAVSFEAAAEHLHPHHHPGLPHPRLRHAGDNRQATANSTNSPRSAGPPDNSLLVNTLALAVGRRRPSPPLMVQPSTSTGAEFNSSATAGSGDQVLPSAHESASVSSSGIFPAGYPPRAVERWAAAHKAPCTAVACTQDGRFCASGGEDFSVRVMSLRTEGGGSSQTRYEPQKMSRVRTRVFTDHRATVNCLAFHPYSPVLFSGSNDKTIHALNFGRKTAVTSSATIQDAYPITALAVHPCGDYLLAGSTDPVVRLHDLNSLECFSSTWRRHHHTGRINDIRCLSNGTAFATCSRDGSIRLWDSTSNRVVNAFHEAHGGASVETVRWSRNNYYILSAGLDGLSRLWDIRVGKQLLSFGPASASRAASFPAVEYNASVLLTDELYVANVCTGSYNSDVSFYNAYTGRLVSNLQFHPGRVSRVEAVPDQLSIVTACADYRCRLVDLFVDNHSHHLDVVAPPGPMDTRSGSVSPPQIMADPVLQNYVSQPPPTGTRSVVTSPRGIVMHDIGVGDGFERGIGGCRGAVVGRLPGSPISGMTSGSSSVMQHHGMSRGGENAAMVVLKDAAVQGGAVEGEEMDVDV